MCFHGLLELLLPKNRTRFQEEIAGMRFDLGLGHDACPETVSTELTKNLEAFLNPAEVTFQHGTTALFSPCERPTYPQSLSNFCKETPMIEVHIDHRSLML